MSPNNWAVLFPKVSFYRTDNTPISLLWNLSKAEHLKCLTLSEVECGGRKQISWKNMQQLPNSWLAFFLKMQQVTNQNNLDPVYTWFKPWTMYGFNSNQWLGEKKLTVILSFLTRISKPSKIASKIARSFLLT